MDDRGHDDMARVLTEHRRAAQARWDRLTTADFAAVGTQADLADAVVRRYGLSRGAAQRDIRLWLDDIGHVGAPSDTAERTSSATIRFPRPFSVASLGRVLPAGDYEVTTVEERIEGLSFLAYRTVSTSLTVPLAGPAGSFEIAGIDPAVIRDALLEGGRGDPGEAPPTGGRA